MSLVLPSWTNTIKRHWGVRITVKMNEIEKTKVNCTFAAELGMFSNAPANLNQKISKTTKIWPAWIDRNKANVKKWRNICLRVFAYLQLPQYWMDMAKCVDVNTWIYGIFWCDWHFWTKMIGKTARRNEYQCQFNWNMFTKCATK